MVPVGQQILVGPVGVVPDGQTQLRVVWLKPMPLGQQGRLPRASWVREREEATAIRARRANADFIRYFNDMSNEANSHLFDLNKHELKLFIFY